jgi:hypothetical protein
LTRGNICTGIGGILFSAGINKKKKGNAAATYSKPLNGCFHFSEFLGRNSPSSAAIKTKIIPNEFICR